MTDRAWWRSGAAALTGHADGRPLDVPNAAAHMQRFARRLAEAGAVEVDGPALLGERAAFTANTRGGRTSVGGTCRLLRAGDGWIALNLARPADIELLPAWLGTAVGEDPWPTIERVAASRPAAEVVAAGAELGLPVAALGEVDAPDDPVRRRRAGAGRHRPCPGCVVVDLSSLWAGPLAANLLGVAGARVVKVESTARPDGAREGSPAFFDLLHGGHESVAVDFRTDEGRRVVRALLERADVVIEASRPRALDQLGLGAETLLTTTNIGVWLSITGYGRASHRVGFGDDAAVAGGLVAWDDDAAPCFAADAAADPATGLLGAAAVAEALGTGDRWLVELSLSATAAWLTTGVDGDGGVAEAPAAPRARPITGVAPALGEHTAAIVAELGLA